MKTPQEEAEEMASQVLPYQEMCGCSSCKKQLSDILTAIPLAELIAVARAANGLSFGQDWNNGTHAKEHGYRQQLLDSLQALRATGKVSL